MLQKSLMFLANRDSVALIRFAAESAMMGRLNHDQGRLFYSFCLEEAVPDDHLVREVAAVLDLSWVHAELAPYYPDNGRPSIDPELMIRMLIIGYVFAIRSERALCRDVQVHLAYRWFCGLSIEDKVPDHSAFSVNRHGRFRDSDIFRQVFEAVVRACMDAGLVKGDRGQHGIVGISGRPAPARHSAYRQSGSGTTD
jgi:transposase